MKLGSPFLAFIVSVALLGCGGSNDSVSPSKDRTAAMRQAAPVPTVQSYNDAVQALYVAYFGRAADPGGLASFSAQLMALGAPADILGLKTAYETNPGIAALVNSFGSSAESQALFGGDTKAFVTAIYANVLNRTPDTEGLAFWSAAIDSGNLTRGGACLAILAGAMVNSTPQGLADGRLVQQKLKLSTAFTTKVSGNNSALYAGSIAAASVRAMLAKLTVTTAEDQFAALVDAQLSLLSEALAPVAGITPPTAATVNSLVFLDGSVSSDPRKLPLAYSWIFISKPAGSSATISSPNSARPYFLVDVAGSYVVSLTVSNGISSTSKITTLTANAVVVPTLPSTPVATAICKDGTFSYSATRSGTCSHHGGVRTWL